MDYSRTEKVQFEDDEYYYYVKAVPKMTVAAQTKTVKKINTQRRPASSRESYHDLVSDNSRSVVTERTYSRNAARSGSLARSNNGQQGVTINSNMIDDAATDNDFEFDYDFEELE